MDNQPLNFLTLTIEELSQKDGRFVIKSGGKSYSFFQNKQDGNPTRAFTDYQKLNPQIGQSYSFGIKETQGDYQGKPITYRNIAVIGPPQDHPQPTTQGVSVEEFNKLIERVAVLERSMAQPEQPEENIIPLPQDDIDVKDIPFG